MGEDEDSTGKEAGAVQDEKIKNEKELEFIVFCIENTAAKLGVNAERVYRALAEKSDMNANPILLQKKYSRVIACFAGQQGISLDEALRCFYYSEVYQLVRDGVSDMHCMSDAYLAEELRQEYQEAGYGS